MYQLENGVELLHNLCKVADLSNTPVKLLSQDAKTPCFSDDHKKFTEMKDGNIKSFTLTSTTKGALE